MDIPKALVDQIQEGNVVLFLGAGASIGAKHPEGKKVPQGQDLADLIANKFLGPNYLKKPLPFVSELAISETNLFQLQAFIAEIIKDFEPASFHVLIPTFVWKAIATTNYDLIIEKAYNSCKEKAQDLAVCKKNGESIETRLASGRNALYLKLHGCITEINDVDLPLILTPDQYITHKQGRSRLFDRVMEYSYEYPFVFVGHSLADLDIRTILLELDQLKSARPRSYVVGPEISDIETRHWESKKITTLKGTFQEFLISLDQCINPSFRKLAAIKPEYQHPIISRFKTTSNLKPSNSLLSFLNNDVDYLHKSFPTKDTDPAAFYKGYFADWDPIIKQLDVRRSITDDILSEVFLATEGEKGSLQELYIIKGHAGSGKTVLLKRLAWDAAFEFDKLCLFVKSQVNISYDSVTELSNLCKERIFLFIDTASDNIEMITGLLSRAKQDRIPLTIVSAERYNEWNSCCVSLESHLTQDYSLKYLNNTEIDKLLNKLTMHKSLGYLEGLTYEKQVESLAKKAGRELLVALHEATLGKPFPEIILDEYKSISSPQAQSLYLTVSILHRLGVGARAGLISRVHGIGFSTFRENLFKPLEYIIFASKDSRINDYVYKTRHTHIADMVFEQVLQNAQDRFDEYVRVISCLDIDYQSDLTAFKSMVNARKLLEIFSDPQMIRQLYEYAEKRSPNDPLLMQQMAIFEMSSPNGSLSKATELLQQANLKAPWYKPIAHSLSELALKKSEKATNSVEKAKLRREAQSLAVQLISQNLETSHAYHTLIKIGLSELSEVITIGDEPSMERLIKETEKTISSAKQVFSDDSSILEAEANFCQLINDEPRAFAALKKAFLSNKRSPFIALRLASMCVHNSKIEEALNILKESLDLNQADKDLNFKYAMILMNQNAPNLSIVRHHLRRSFTQGDNRYNAQFWYARCAYIMNDIDEATKIFGYLRELNLNIALKRNPAGFVYDSNGNLEFCRGTISKIELSFAFITRDGISDSIFVYRYHDHKSEWADLSIGCRVTFNLAFTYRGPIAMNLERLE